MFSNRFTNKDPLVEAVQNAMKEGEYRRQAEAIVNEEFGVYSRNAVVREHLAAYDAAIEEVFANLKEGVQIDEVSKEKLGRYIKGASHDVATKSALTRAHAMKSDDARKSEKYMDAKKHDELSNKMFDKSWKRRQGIAKAVDKLTKEEYEQLDEVSKKKLEKYGHGVTAWERKHRKKMDVANNTNHDDPEKKVKWASGVLRKRGKRLDSVSLAQDKMTKANDPSWKWAKVAATNEELAKKDYDKDGKIESPKDEVWGSRLRAAKKAGKLKEEEQIDEISKERVKKYKEASKQSLSGLNSYERFTIDNLTDGDTKKKSLDWIRGQKKKKRKRSE